MTAQPSVGKLGEIQLSRWAAEEGLVVNRSIEDRTGWDFFVEWPLERSGLHTPLDQGEGPLQCLVQVKASSRKDKRHSVRLTNWLRFVQSPLPCFFLLLEFDQAKQCVGASVIHVDEAWMYKVLKRLREFAGDGSDINRRYITISARQGTSLSTLSGSALEGLLRKAIGPSLSAYVAEKDKARSELGYGEVTGELKLTFEMDRNTNPSEVLVDLYLGLIPDLNVISGEYLDNRFGIPRKNPRFDISEGSKLTLSPTESRPGKLIIERPGSAEKLVLNTDVIVPPLGHLLEEKYLKIRATAPFVDFLWRPWGDPKCDFKFSFPPATEPHALKRFADAARLIRFLGYSGEFDHLPRLHVYLDGDRIASGTFRGLAAPPAPLQEWAEAVEDAYAIAQRYSIDGDAESTISDLIRQRPRLQLLRTVLSAPLRSMRMIFDLDEAPDDEGKEWCIPGATEVAFGHYEIQVAWRLLGRSTLVEVSERGHQYQLTSRDIRVADESVVVAPETHPRSIQDQIDSIVQQDEDSRMVMNPVGIFS